METAETIAAEAIVETAADAITTESAETAVETTAMIVLPEKEAENNVNA